MPTARPLAAAAALGASIVLAACTESPTETAAGPQLAVVESPQAAYMAGMLESTNLGLVEAGAPYRAAMAEYITHADAQVVGLTVLAKNVGNRRLPFDFVPNDTRRPWSGPAVGATDDITYAIDRTGDAIPPLGGLDGAATDAAIVRAMAQWDGLTCSDIALTRNDDFGVDVGVAAFELGFGGSPFVFADVQHAGWRDVDLPEGVLGVTVTYAFTDDAGLLTDVNGDRYFDAAFREIYYDPSYPWTDDGVSNVDVESVALHEAGHGISQGHFGQVALKRDGSLLLSPAAVMNALYAAPSRTLLGTDIAGHCDNWAAWRR